MALPRATFEQDHDEPERSEQTAQHEAGSGVIQPAEQRRPGNGAQGPRNDQDVHRNTCH